MIHTQIVRP